MHFYGVIKESNKSVKKEHNIRCTVVKNKRKFLSTSKVSVIKVELQHTTKQEKQIIMNANKHTHTPLYFNFYLGIYLKQAKVNLLTPFII